MYSKWCTSFVICLLVLSYACGGAPASPQATPTSDLGPQETATAQAVEAQKATENAQETAIALETANAQATLDAQATETAIATQNAIATATQKALNTQATATQAVIKKQTATAQAALDATATAQPLFDMVQKLFAVGLIEATEGTYLALEDFNASWAQLGSGQYFRTGFSPESFVFSAHVQLNSASESANWFQSTCGVIFSEKSNNDYNLVDVAMDGLAYSWVCRGGGCRGIAAIRYGEPMKPQGEADILLAVYKQRYHFFVNGNKIFSATDLTIRAGNLAYLLRSGTNKGFGTRCEMTNVGLWLFE